MPIDDTIREEALDWAVRTGDAGFADWDAFVAWMERDPRHAQAYDTVMAATGEAVAMMQAAAPANDDGFVAPFAPASGLPSSFPPKRRWLGSLVAMALVVAVGLGLWQKNAPDYYMVETAPGTLRTVALDSGTHVDIAGGSRVEFDRKDPRYASLESGRALFTVRHDEADPFRVAVGGDMLVDVGTVFEVHYDYAAFSVAVSEGAVQFNPDEENVHVAAGQRLARRGGGLQLARVESTQVGEWREGRLTFDGEPLSAVVRDLTRATGVSFTVDAARAGQAVSGSILIDPVRKDPAQLGPLLGVDIARKGDGWVLGSA